MLNHPVGAAGITVVGLLVLLAGGHWLVNGSVAIARRFGISTLLVGLTIVAMGTSAPELAFNVIAALSNHADLSFGNVIGSNIANIGLILGVSALYRPLNVHGHVINKELPWLLVVSALMFVFVMKVPFAGETAYGFSRYDGGAMLLLFALFMIGWIRMGRRETADPLTAQLRAEAEAAGSFPGAVLLVLLGLACLVGGGKLGELGAVHLARWLGLSQAVIGLTIVAFATSLPELVTGIIACRKGHDDLAVGNVVGSNMFNLLLVLGLTAVVAPVPLPTAHGWQDLGVMMAITIVLAFMSFSRRTISRGEGATLLLLYLGYMAWSVIREVRPP
jgi:cation:H+ antiporter